MNKKHWYVILMPIFTLGLSNNILIKPDNSNKVDIVDRNIVSYNETIYENYNFQSNEYALDILNQGKQQRSLISRYPDAISKPSDFKDDLDYFKEISKGSRNKWWGNEKDVITFDIGTLGFENKQKFLVEYSQLNIDFNYGYNITNNGANGWINGSEGAEIKTPLNRTEIIKLNQDKTVIVKDYSWAHHSNSYHKIKMSLSFSWTSATAFKLSFYSKASLDYNSLSKYKHAAYTGFKFNYATIS